MPMTELSCERVQNKEWKVNEQTVKYFFKMFRPLSYVQNNLAISYSIIKGKFSENAHATYSGMYHYVTSYIYIRT